MDRTKIVVEAEVIAQSGCYHVLRVVEEVLQRLPHMRIF